MKTVDFLQEYAGSNVYCVIPNEPFHEDHSGRYVPAEVAERLLAALKLCLEYFEYVYKGEKEEALRKKLKAILAEEE